jgi:antitoxin component of RelBE/YafQ-DinJ toxin-antitoxin module
MATNSQYITIRISQEGKDYIERVASEEKRTVSQVARLMLEYAILAKQGQEKRDKQSRRARCMP